MTRRAALTVRLPGDRTMPAIIPTVAVLDSFRASQISD